VAVTAAPRALASDVTAGFMAGHRWRSGDCQT
jgi:hypothetical protein